MEDEPIQPEQLAHSYSDDQQDYGEYVAEQQEEQQFNPQQYAQREKESIFTFFKHIVGIKDSSKVANLDKRELGFLDLSVRSYEYLANLGMLLHNKSYNQFFMGNAEIVLATSMSKKGWLPELVISQKRFTQRSLQPTVVPPAKTGFLGFGKKRPVTE
jgi:hypothetical protein